MSDAYLTRYLDNIVTKRLEMIGAIVIIGPKWCGKTTTAKQFAKSELYLQNPNSIESYKELASFMPSKLLEGEKPKLIDEWQDLPILWDTIRSYVDKEQKDGLFLLTGSTVIDILK